MSTNCFITLGAGVEIREANRQMTAPSKRVNRCSESTTPQGFISSHPFWMENVLWDHDLSFLPLFHLLPSSQNPLNNYQSFKFRAIPVIPRAPHSHWDAVDHRKNEHLSHSFTPHTQRACHEACDSETAPILKVVLISHLAVNAQELFAERIIPTCGCAGLAAA